MATWLEVLLGVLYLIALVWLGLTALRKGHFAFFAIGFFIPLFWIVGALLPPTLRARAAAREASAGEV